MAERVGLISLGCAKNLVNSEQMLWLLDEAGYEITPEAENADVVVVNTCGFIESAKSEAIENILELAQLKKEGKIKKIIVAGCLAERYKDEVLEQIPEVDALIGCGSYSRIVSAVDKALSGEKPSYFDDINETGEEGSRVLTTPDHTAYIKIAEGCDNRCAYCVIPSLRGKYRSRPMERILEEATAIAQGGAKELIVIAQDITRYGLDLYGERRLSDLLRAMCEIEGVEWIRLHYLYPDGFTQALIDTIAQEDKIVKYLDIPIQHINDDLLRSMNRRGTGQEIEALFSSLRARIPGLVLRTSLIVGLPGETETEFAQLCSFLKKAKIERAGVFPYSAEEGTPAALMDGQVPEETKYRRAEIVMGIQQKIMDAYNRGMKGRQLRVLCEGYDRYAGCYFGRSFADSPEIDGKVFFKSEQKLAAGAFINVQITGSISGDLRGKAVTAQESI